MSFNPLVVWQTLYLACFMVTFIVHNFIYSTKP